MLKNTRAYDAIETDFLNKYVTNGFAKTRQHVFKLLGQINTANSIEMKNEIDRIYKEKTGGLKKRAKKLALKSIVLN